MQVSHCQYAKQVSLTENTIFQENLSEDENTLNNENIQKSNDELVDDLNLSIDQLSKSDDLEEEQEIIKTEGLDLEKNINEKKYLEDENPETINQIENNNLSNDLKSSSAESENTSETSVRRLSLFDTLATENKTEDSSLQNNVVEKNEPVFASSDEEIKEVESENSNLDINEKEEFNAEETDSSEIEDEFNQETEEELLDIPTFLRRQAN